MLKLRKVYSGIIISRTIPGIGTITFDPNQVKECDYINFIDFGFDFIFENVEIENSGRKNSIKNKIEKSDIKVK
jgi:hypothetical protein